MASVTTLFLFMCLSVYMGLAQASTTTISTKKFAFEKVCSEDYGTVVGRYYKIRDRAICGVKCANLGTCNSFLYSTGTRFCKLFSNLFMNRTNIGCADTIDYTEITTLDPLRFATDLGPYCIGACTNERNGFRLCDGGGAGVCNPTQGRLEVFYNNAWGTICDDHWSNVNANVACRTLGYTSGVSQPNAYFGMGVGTIMLDEVTCVGTEYSLALCSHQTWKINDCDHSEDEGVVCFI